MIFAVLIVLVSILLFILYRNREKQGYADVERIPGPPVRPLIGNALEFGTNTVDILLNLKRLVKQYGRIVRLWVGPSLYILLSEPRYTAQLLLSDEQYKSDLYRFAKPIIGEGVGGSSGERWKKQRRLLAPSFNSKFVEKFTPVFNKNINEMVGRFKALANLDYVDVTNYVWKCGFDNICDATLGVNVKATEEYAKSVKWLMTNVTNRNFSIIKRFDFLYRLTRDYKTEVEMTQLLDNFSDSIIAARKKQRLAQSPDQTTFLDHMLNTSEEDPSFTDVDIRDHLKTFIVVGSDTVVTSVSFGIFELAKHPDIQQKILEEIQTVVGVDRNVDLDFDNVENLKYTDCVFKEILRLYGPAAIFERRLKNAIRFDDYAIPAGTTIILFTGAMHLDERNFPEPTSFDPDRFLNNTFASAYMPFGCGTRICIGQKFGTVEAKLMLASIIRNFEIEAVQPPHEVVYSMESTLKCASGLPVRLKVR